MMHLILFLKLAVGHFLCDYPLQGDFLSRAKNHRQPIPGVPWYQALVAHATIQAGTVWLLTGSLLCGALELVMHVTIDFLKCDERLSFNNDQALHLACKVFYVALLPATS